jgi:hypothetical protein
MDKKIIKNQISIFSYLNYLGFFYKNYLIIYTIFIIILINLYFEKTINKYYLVLFIILFIILYVFPDFTWNRTNRCYLLSNEIIANNKIKPIESKTDLLEKPIKEFYINSSHNSYLSCNQNIDIASTEAIKKTLQMGARCIELDIHDKDNMPVVAHGLPNFLTTTYLSFEDCIDVIKDYGFLTSDPLILFLEVVTNNNEVLKKVNNIIKTKLGNKLLGSEYKLNKEKKFINEPIKNLLNKIIIVNSTNVYNNLEDILDDDTSLVRNHDSVSKNKYENNMQRIFSAIHVCIQFSCNYDPIVHWKNRANFVSLNFQTFDDALYTNYIMFKDYSFVHFSEVSFD